MDVKYRKLGKNSLFVFIGNVGGRIISFLMMPLYTRWLSQADYGAAEMIQCYAVILLDIISFCLCSAIFVFPKNANYQDKKKFFSSGLFFSSISSFIVLYLLYLFAEFLLPTENLFHQRFDLIAILSVACYIQNYCQNFVRSIDMMKVYSITGFLYTGCTAIYSMILIPILGMTGFVYSLAGANLTSALYIFIVAKLYRYLTFSIRWLYYKNMVKYSYPLIGTVLISFFGTYLSRPLLEYYYGLSVVGQFVVANKFSSILYTLIPVFCLAWQASVLEEFGKKNYRKFFNKIFRIIFVGFMTLCFIMIPLYPLILKIFAASNYSSVWVYMPFMALVNPIAMYIQYTQANFLAAKKSTYILICSIVSASVSVLANVLLIPHYAIWGNVAASILATNISAICYYFFSSKYVRLDHRKYYLFIIAMYITVAILAILINDTLINSLIVFAVVSLFLFIEKNNCIKILSIIGEKFNIRMTQMP